MENRWSQSQASAFVKEHGPRWGEDLALRTYASRLLGAEPALVLHGGGNTSVKSTRVNRLDEEVAAIYVKASGHDLATIEPEGHPALDLAYLRKLRRLDKLSDEAMFDELETHRLSGTSTPSLEALLHVFVPPKVIDHTHADALLSLTNRPDGREVVGEAMGDDVILLDYVLPGFDLARAAADAFDAQPGAKGMVLMHHGLLTWGETAQQSYGRTIELVSRAEQFLAAEKTQRIVAAQAPDAQAAQERYRKLAPVLRGQLSVPTKDPDRPYRQPILRPLQTVEALTLVDAEQGRDIALSPPLTTDHLIRTKALPLWLDDPQLDDPDRLREQLSQAVTTYTEQYDAYVNRHAARMPAGLERFDPLPRVVLIPGLGAICAGPNVRQADIVRDITQQTLSTKLRIAASGPYEGLAEAHLFDMEYRGVQHAKLGEAAPTLERTVALVTGAAGAIGSGIVQKLLERGCHVACSDLPGEHLDSQVANHRTTHGDRALAVPLDITDPDAVASGFDEVSRAWGGVDLVVANAGLAHVSSLADMKLDDFQRLTRVNVEGTLHLLSEAARHFAVQQIGGDVVLISTKNVFFPGASFGAYSATKAAAHQLARIASLELAPLGVRVNMVSPDAVFSHGTRRSGLWAEVGPGRMRARNLDEQGLEEYYQNRNLLKAQVTAEHVANAVLYFATRQSPTTGATLPVDGGLPDSTPR